MVKFESCLRVETGNVDFDATRAGASHQSVVSHPSIPRVAGSLSFARFFPRLIARMAGISCLAS